MLSWLRTLRTLWNNYRFRRAVRAIDRIEAEARQANNCRAIHAATRRRYDAVHADLTRSRANGWRGSR